MTDPAVRAPLARVETLSHGFAGHPALRGITADIRPGLMTGLIGPDGAGKTTLLRLLAGLLRPQDGRVTVLGHDMATDAAAAHRAIGYMSQRFGLYEDLTVGENLDLFADLHGLDQATRAARIARLLRFTALAPFGNRLAGKLSGGMKQKLGLACALLARPRLLLLDEPSVGVDPASRRELWSIVTTMLAEARAEGGAAAMGVVWATAYQDEAARCDRVLMLHQGVLLADAPPAEILAPLRGRVFRRAVPSAQRRAAARRAGADPAVLDASVDGDAIRVILRADAVTIAAGTDASLEATPPRFEDAFLAAIAADTPTTPAVTAAPAAPPPPRARSWTGAAIAVDHLVRRFGAFTAVDGVSFSVAPGEIFGLLGPNGAGKSTTFRMLCGLLRPTAGSARVAGKDLLRAPAEARARIGYMAQRFSLYGELSARDNLRFFARVYGLSGARQREAVARALDRFDLRAVRDAVSGELPLGVKQRLALAAALMHDPDILFLDEPTSGVDPIARRAFWRRIGDLAETGVAVLVTSHFMEEAENCDRLGIIDSGRLIATATPAELRARARAAALPDPTLEDAFIALVGEAASRRDAA